jgi:hypothetical protein
MVTLWVGPRRLRQHAYHQQRQDGDTNSSCKLRDSHDGPHFKRFEYSNISVPPGLNGSKTFTSKNKLGQKRNSAALTYEIGEGRSPKILRTTSF